MHHDTLAGVEAEGTRDEPDAPPRRLGWMPVVGLLAAVVAWIRVPSALRDNLYAEDGVVFVGGWAWPRSVSLFWEPYGGYQHLLPRFGSWLVVNLLPVASWGYAITAFACVVVGLVAAAVYACSADLVTFWPARIVLGLLVALVPVAGVEPLGNLANLHWFMIMLMPWVLLARPRTRWGLALLVVVTLVATLSEPTCIIFAPLALWRFVTARRERLIVVAWAVGVAAQVVTTLLAPRPRTPGRPPWLSVALGYVRDVGMSMVTAEPRRLGLAITTVGWWTGLVWVLGILVVAGVAAWFASRDVRVLLAALLIGSVASWSAAFITNNAREYYFSVLTDNELLALPLSRWATAASMMLAATVPVAVAVLVTRFPRLRPVGGGILGVMLVLLAINVPARSTPDYESWSVQMDEDMTSCGTSDSELRVHGAPENWRFSIPCSALDR